MTEEESGQVRQGGTATSAPEDAQVGEIASTVSEGGADGTIGAASMESAAGASSGPRIGIRTMTYVAVTVALAAVLNYFPLFKMPQGGSVALDMLPIVFLAYYRGVGPAVLAGAIFGFVNAMMFPTYVHPAQLILDYPLAFGLVGLAGLIPGRGPVAVAAGAVFAGLLRFGAHYVSGVIFFAEYAPKGQSPWLYSAIYNSTYISVSLLMTVPLVFTLLKAMGPGRERN